MDLMCRKLVICFLFVALTDATFPFESQFLLSLQGGNDCISPHKPQDPGPLGVV